MTPESLVIDREFDGVGRIVRATGSVLPAVRASMNKMLDDLADPADPHLDILRAIKSGELSLLEVYDAYRHRRLHTLATGDSLKPLAVTMRAWIDSLDVPADISAKHKVSLGTSLGYLDRHKPKAVVADIAVIVRELRGTLGRSHARSFNLCRSAAMAFIRDTLTINHRLWADLRVIPVKKESKKAPREGITPARMRALFPKPDTDHVDAIAWSMITSGMHQEEYWGSWNVKADRIHIAGTKRAGRKRDVPLLWHPVVPRMHRRTFENKVRDRTSDVQPYDFRRAYSQWLEEAGVTRARRRMYLGHGAADTTDLYERHEVTAFLQSDAKKLRAFLKLKKQRQHLRLVSA